jgi:hypothetical protein
MSQGWLIVAVITIVVVVAWSSYEVFRIVQPQDPSGVIEVVPIDRTFDTEVVNAVVSREGNVIIKNDEIQPN